MKKLAKLSIIVGIFLLSSCVKDANEVNKEETYQIKENLNLELTCSNIEIINNDDLLDNQIKISNKLEFELTENDNSIDIKNISKGKNSIKLETNSSTKFNLNLTGEEIDIVSKNKSLNNIDINSKSLNINFYKINLDDLNLNYQYSRYIKIDNCKMANLKSVGIDTKSYTLNWSQFNVFDIKNAKSSTHIFDNIFSEGYINQDIGRIDGQMLAQFGYTLNCNAKYLKLDNMHAKDNIYLDGMIKVNFNSTHGEVELWVCL